MAVFNEANTTEQMMIHTLSRNGWEYVPPEALDREERDVMVEPMVRAALIRLNPEIAEDVSRADEILHKLRRLFRAADAHNLVTQNEQAAMSRAFRRCSCPTSLALPPRAGITAMALCACPLQSGGHGIQRRTSLTEVWLRCRAA